MTQVICPTLSPGKGWRPKSQAKRERQRYLVKAAAEYKRALTRKKYGSLGAASKVRRIDPATFKPVPGARPG